MKIRDANPDDAAAIANFNILLARETEDIELDATIIADGVRALLADESKGRYFLAEIDSEIVGQIMVTYEWSDWRNGNIWWIQSVYVDAAFRRRGIYRALYQHVYEQAKCSNAVGIRLYVDADNLAAQQTYDALGMHISNYKLMEAMLLPSQTE